MACEYYFLFSHGLSVTNIPRYELLSVLGKLAEIPVDRQRIQHNENGTWVSLDAPLSDRMLREIFFLTGYVQYGGPVLIHRPWAEVGQQELCEALVDYLNVHPDLDQVEPVLMANTVEGFRVAWPYRLPGVAGSRFYRDKYFFKDRPAAVVLREMDPRGGAPEGLWKGLGIKVIDSRASLEAYMEERAARPEAKRPLCLYLFQDHCRASTSAQARYPGADVETQLVLVDSRYSAKNMVHLFDDDKPYWPERITTPPRLAAAALNLSDVPLPGDDGGGRDDSAEYTILDPFVGTGTTLLEAMKYPVSITGNDLDPEIGIKDNISFFTEQEGATVRRLVRHIERHLVDRRDPFLFRLMPIMAGCYGGEPDFANDVSLSHLVGILSGKRDPVAPRYAVLFGPSDNALFQRDGLTFRDLLGAFCKHHDMASPRDRYLVYQVYRVLRQHYPECVFSNHHVDHALFGDVYRRQWSPEHDHGQFKEDHLRSKLELLAEQLERMDEVRSRGAETYETRLREGVPFRPLVSGDAIKLLNQDILDLSGLPAGELNETLTESSAPSVNLVISDLPYSMNTEVDALAELYGAFFALCIKVLRPGGEVILFVLDKVRSGKTVPPAAFSERVQQQMEAQFKEAGRPLAYVPRDLEDDNSPGVLYWKSAKALNRVVLHYRIAQEVTPRTGDRSSPSS